MLRKVQLDSGHKQAIMEVLVPLPPTLPVPLGSLGDMGVIADQPGWPGPDGPGGGSLPARGLAAQHTCALLLCRSCVPTVVACCQLTSFRNSSTSLIRG